MFDIGYNNTEKRITEKYYPNTDFIAKHNGIEYHLRLLNAKKVRITTIGLAIH